MAQGGHGEHGGHGHDHGRSHGHSHNGAPCNGHGSDLEVPLIEKRQPHSDFPDEQAKLKKAVYFALFMMFVEIFGGILANSLAIITDAAHMLSDVGGFIVSLVCLQLAAGGVTSEYTYGFKQAEVLGALLSIMIVWALTACLLMEAVERLYNLEEINAPYMFGISTLGFFVNLVLMKVLGHNHAHGGHDHGHGHGHGGHEDHAEDEEASLAMKAAIAHVIGDIVQSLGVCLAALCIWVKPFDLGVTDEGVSKWNYADPMCTFLFGILVLFTTKSTLKQTINTLMVKAPPQINQAKLTDKLQKCPNVVSMHDLHVWTMGSNDVLCTAHLMIDNKEHCTAALKGAIEAAKSMGIAHSTFQIEIDGEFDPSLESYGLHDNPVESPTVKASGHGHSHGGGGHSQSGGEHSHGGGGHSHSGGQSHGGGHSHDGGHKHGGGGHGHDGGHKHGGGGHSHDGGHKHGGGGHGHDGGHKHGGGGHGHDCSGHSH